MNPLKYSYESLQQFCLQNGIELCKDYNDQPVNRNTRIEGKCVKSDCDGVFCKSFREILENATYYCRPCLNKVADVKRKQTCINKYGVNTVMHIKETKEKIKETSLQKYGVEFSFQSEIVKDKIKETNIERYGCKNAMQNKKVREKCNKTCLEKYGVEHILQSEIFKTKYKSIILARFGVENPSQNYEIKQRKITTCLKNYGVEHPSQNNEIKQRKIETSLKNYGVEYPMQSSEVLSNNIKNNYKTKPYIFPSGKVEQIQGDEQYALDELIHIEKIVEKGKRSILLMPRVPCIVGEVGAGTAAEKNGLLANDKIIGIDSFKIDFFDQVKPLIAHKAGDSVQLHIIRKGQSLVLNSVINPDTSIGFFPAVPSLAEMKDQGLYTFETKNFSFLASFPAGVKKAGEKLSSYVSQFKKILNPSTGAYKGLGGFKSMGSIFPKYEWDWEAFWNITAFFSIALAFMNLLPIPALDGGHVLFTIYEMVTGRKPNEKFLEYAQIVGMALLFGLMIYANANDWLGWGRSR
jgi:RIP metalloprotease RseP